MEIAIKEYCLGTFLSGRRINVLILLTNDDGVYAPGLAAMQRQLQILGDVYLVAPATEQSGVGHAITYLTPLIVKEVFHGEQRWGWAVDGSPADCVKIGVTELCPRKPDLVVSGINGGQNAGINVLYSGTVAAAIEGAFFGITSVAVSLEFDEHANFDKAAQLARMIIEQIIQNEEGQPELYNLNIPTAATDGTPSVSVAPMDVTQYIDKYEKRFDPWGRDYYWVTGGPPKGKGGAETDLSALAEGNIALTPLDFDMTKRSTLKQMQPWRFNLTETTPDGESAACCDSQMPAFSTKRMRKPKG
jgi:5'-nucleotidase